MSIQAEHYRSIDNELRSKHDYFVGQDLPDGYSYFTLDQQIERYSKTLAFWMTEKEKNQMTTSSFRNPSGAAMARVFLVSQRYNDFSKRMQSVFDHATCKEIYELAKGYKQVMNDLMPKGGDDAPKDELDGKDPVASEWLPTGYMKSTAANPKRRQK